jgi:SnoaL-like domain
MRLLVCAGTATMSTIIEIRKMDELTPGRGFYNDQVAYLEANDVDGLVRSHYNADAAMIGFDFVVRGHEALRQQFRDYLNSIGRLRLKSTDRFVETGDTIFFESTITTNQGDIRIYDAFVLADGKISIHFTGVKG